VGTSARDGSNVPPEEVEMGIGLGIVLIVIGAALVWAVNVDIQFIDDNNLGWILLIVGAVAIVLSLVINAQRSRTTTRVEERRLDGRYPESR
jgi:H+/Cl- antiporter ClcA